MAGDADDRVELEQRQRGGRIVEIDAPAPELLLELGGQRVHVHLEPDGERRRGAHAGSDPAVVLAFDGLVELERVAPPGLVAERVVAEDLPPFRELGARELLNDVVEVPVRAPRVAPAFRRGLRERQPEHAARDDGCCQTKASPGVHD